MTIKGVWSLIKRGFVLCVVLVVVAVILFIRRSDDELTQFVRRSLERKFPQADVSFESVKLIDARGVLVRGVQISCPDLPKNEAAVFWADEVFIECPISVETIWTQKAIPTKATVLRPTFLVKSPFERLNRSLFLKFKPVRTEDDIPFPVEFREGKIVYENPTSPSSEPFVFNGIQGTLSPPTSNGRDRQGSDSVLLDENQAKNGDFQTAIGDVWLKKSNDSKKVASNVELASKGSTNEISEQKSTGGESFPFWRFSATASNSLVRLLTLDGSFGDDGWRLRGRTDRLDVGTELVDFFARSFGASQQYLETIEGRTSFDFSAESDSASVRGFRFDLNGEATRGNAKISLLKYPVSDIELKYSIRDELFQIERLSARNGSATISIQYWQNGLTVAPKDARLQIALNEFPLDDETIRRFDSVFPPTLRKILSEYQFSTISDIQTTLERRDQKWFPQRLSFDCRNLRGLYRKFPYELDGLAGKLTLDEKANLQFSFVSEGKTPDRFEQEQFQIQGNLSNVLIDAVGQIEAEGINCSLNQKLFDAIPDSCRQEILRLRPEGTIDANLKFTLNSNDSNSEKSNDEANFAVPATNVASSLTNPSGQIPTERRPPKPLDFCYIVGVRDASIRYERFPFPIQDISGLIKFENDVWAFSNFRGSNGSTSFGASGFLAPNDENGDDVDNAVGNNIQTPIAQNVVSNDVRSQSESSPIQVPETDKSKNRRFYLSVETNGFPLGEELQNALARSQYRELLESLHLVGKADGQVHISYETAPKTFDLELEADLIPELTSMKSESFPYELKRLEGHIVYRRGEVLIENLRGQNGQLSSNARVLCRFLPNGSWTLDLDPVQIDQIHFDHDLQKAVPSSLLTFFDQFKLSGYFNLSGRARFSRASAQSPLVSFWNTNVVMQQNVAQLGASIQNICGRSKFCGRAVENESVQLHGELDIDSFCVEDVQITRMTGPIYFDGGNFLFGRDVPPWTEISFYQNEFFKNETDLFRKNHYYEKPAPSASNLSPVSYSTTETPQNSSTSVDDQRSSDLNGVVSSVLTESSSVRRPIRGLVFHGIAELSGKVLLTDPTVYQLNFLLKDSLLNELTRDLASSSKPLQGKATVFSILQGEGRNIATLKGEGGLILKDAELYELPQIIKILQLFSVREPDRTAFNSSVVDFRVFGNRLCLDRVILEGNSLTLFGNGWLTLEKNAKLIDLTMNSRLGNQKNQIPIVSDVLGNAGDQISQIRVEGPLSDPVIRADRFPGIKKAIWSVFPGQEPEPSEAIPTERPRPLRDAWKKLFP